MAHRHWREVLRIDPLDEDPAGEAPDLAMEERSRMIAAAVQSLPPLQREAVLLFEYEGFRWRRLRGWRARTRERSSRGCIGHGRDCGGFWLR